MRVGVIAALCGAALFATGVQAVEGQRPRSRIQGCDNLGKLLADICLLDGQDGLGCVREDMQKAGFVEGRDYTVQKSRLICK